MVYQDAHGDRYRLLCVKNGLHKVNYNSRPGCESIVAVKGSTSSAPSGGIIPHHETFSTTVQPSYGSTKG